MLEFRDGVSIGYQTKSHRQTHEEQLHFRFPNLTLSRSHAPRAEATKIPVKN